MVRLLEAVACWSPAISIWLGTWLLAQVPAEGPTPTTIIGMLGLLVASVTILLGVVVRWLLEANTKARQDAVDAAKNAALVIETVTTNSTKAIQEANASAIEAWKCANEEIRLVRTEMNKEIERARDFYADMASAAKETAIAWQELSQRLPGTLPIKRMEDVINKKESLQ